MSFRNFVFCILLLAIMPIDNLNGWILTHLGTQHSWVPAIKFLYLLVCILFLFSIRKFSSIILLGLLYLTLTASPIASCLSQQGCSDLAASYSILIKTLYFPTMVLTSFNFFKQNAVDFKTLAKTYLALLIMMSGFLIIGAFFGGRTNYGMHTSGVAFGYRGFFISGNELSLTFLMLVGPVVWLAFFGRYRLIIEGLFLAIAFLSAILIATKSAIMGVCIYFFLILGLRLFNLKKLSLKKSATKYIVLICVLCIAIAAVFQEKISVNVERISENIRTASSPLSFWLSGRNENAEYLFDLIQTSNSRQFFFGHGWLEMQNRIQSFGGQGSAEIDLLDIWVGLGFFPMLILYICWVYVLVKILSHSYLQKELAVVASMALIALALSVVQGHILYATTGTFFLSLPVGWALARISKHGSSETPNRSFE